MEPTLACWQDDIDWWTALHCSEEPCSAVQCAVKNPAVLCSVHCEVGSMQCAVLCSVLCTVGSMQCAVHNSVQCTVQQCLVRAGLAASPVAKVAASSDEGGGGLPQQSPQGPACQEDQEEDWQGEQQGGGQDGGQEEAGEHDCPGPPRNLVNAKSLLVKVFMFVEIY